MKFKYRILIIVLLVVGIFSCEDASDAETNGSTTNVDIFIEAEVIPAPESSLPTFFFFADSLANNRGFRLGNAPRVVTIGDGDNETETDRDEIRVNPVFINNLNGVLRRDDDLSDSTVPGIELENGDLIRDPELYLLYRDLTPNVERRIWDFFPGEGGFFDPRNAENEGTSRFDFFDEQFNLIDPDSLRNYNEPVLILRPKDGVGQLVIDDMGNIIDQSGEELPVEARLGVFFENSAGFVERPFRFTIN